MENNITSTIFPILHKFWDLVPSGKLLSCWAIVISFLSITLSLLLSYKSSKGKIFISLHPIYVLNDEGRAKDGLEMAYQTAEITLINYFKKTKYITEILLCFPEPFHGHIFPIYQEQIKIKAGEMIKIPVPIKQEYLGYFHIYKLGYNSQHIVKAIAVDSLHKKWTSKDGLTPGNISAIANKVQLKYFKQ